MTLAMKTTAVFAVLSLAACGGSGSGGDVVQTPSFTDAEQALRTFAQTDGSLTDALEDGSTLSSRAGTAAGIQLRFNGGATNLTALTASVSRNADGELTATLNGQSRVFTLADRQVEDDGNSYGYEFEADDGTTFSLFHFGGTLEELLTDETAYGTVVSVAGDLGPTGGDTLYNRSFVAIGTETTDAALAEGTGTATYETFGRIDFYPSQDFINSGTSRNRLRGDVTLTADFDAGEIGGAMDNITLQVPGASDRTDMAGQIDFETTSFSDNTFSGDLSGDGDLVASGVVLNDDANYNGAFFGPDADEVQGVISATGTLNGVDMNAIGLFTQ